MTLTCDEVLRLMEGVAKNRIGSMEFDGLKLNLAVERPALPALSAASGIAFPNAPPVQPQPPATPENAMKAVQAARMQARANAEAKLSVAQTRTSRARAKAAGGIGLSPSKLADDIYKDALATPVPPPTSVLDKPKQS